MTIWGLSGENLLKMGIQKDDQIRFMDAKKKMNGKENITPEWSPVLYAFDFNV